MNCLCKCPDYINIPSAGGFHDTIYLHLGNQPVLHGKKADKECCDCGTPICADCGEYDIRNHFTEDMTAFLYYQVWQCPTCAEVTNG